MTINKIGIIGGGSWATALLKIFSDSQKTIDDLTINWWLRKQVYVEKIYELGYNPNYLRELKINLNVVKPNSNLETVIVNSNLLVIALPGAFLLDIFKYFNTLFADKTIIVSVKGMIYEKNMLITDYLNKVIGLDQDKIAVLSGPCHAEEVVLEKYAYLTSAAHSIELAKNISNFINTSYIKPIISDDINGIQYISILKNIIAIACGLAHGLGYGDNFISVLVCNAQIEIQRFLTIVCPKRRLLSQSVYLGDLLVTCYSQFSRNRILGNMLGRGYSLKSAQLQMKMIAEGYYATKCIFQLAEDLKIDLPIIESIYYILYKNGHRAKIFEKLKKKFV